MDRDGSQALANIPFYRDRLAGRLDEGCAATQKGLKKMIKEKINVAAKRKRRE